MRKSFTLLAGIICLLCSCHSAKMTQQAVVVKDTVAAVVIAPVTNHEKDDSIAFIKEVYNQMQGNHLDFSTFSAKIDVDYENSTGKKYNVNAHLRMQKDSVIWISITAILGIEGMRLYITPDSVKMLDKQNKIYTVRDIAFLHEITGLPLDFGTLQDLLIGNPIFFDSAILNYTKTDKTISLLYENEYIRNLLTVGGTDKLLQSSKLEEKSVTKKRMSDLTYSDYENIKEGLFAEKRTINISDTSRINIKMDFKQYEFNEKLSFPFSVPKSYSWN